MKKRSIMVGQLKTSVSLEDDFWLVLKEIAAARGMTLSQLASEVDDNRVHSNLSSALRLTALAHYRQPLVDSKAGGGSGDPVEVKLSP